MIAVLTSALLVAGCASSEPEEPVAVDPSEVQSLQPPPGVQLSDHECLVGGWSVQGEPLDAYLDSFGPGAEVGVTGELTMGFTLERYRVAPRVGVVWQNRGTETLTSLVGESEGAYLVEGSALVLEVERDDIEFVDVEDGERSRVTSLFLHPVSINPLANAVVECSGDSLTIVSAADLDGITVSVTLERTR